MEIDWKAVMAEIGALTSERLEYFVDSNKEDLKAYGQDIAKSLIVALRSGREDLRDEIYEQIEMVAELHRIKMNREAREMVRSILEIGMRIGKVAIAAAL